MLTKLNTRFLMTAAVAVVMAGTSCTKEAKTETASLSSDAALRSMISENGANPDDISLSDATGKEAQEYGYVYTESNDASHNSILVFKQKYDGMLTLASTVASGGKGTSAGLASQGAIVIDEAHKYLFAVNAGDNTISSFWIHSDGSLTLASTCGSGGTMPISVSCHENLLYAVNSGSDNICGFAIGADGSLTQMQGSVQSLSGTGVAPAEIKFHPEGHVLFVTEKNTNKIASFALDETGMAKPGVFTASAGMTPYGFDFAKNKNFMIVSNAAGGAADAGSCTSYSTSTSGVVAAINGPVKDNQSAPCWIAPTYYGRYAYTSNTASNSISVYYVAPGGRLYLIPFATTAAGKAPIDITVSANNRFFYSLNSMSYSISQYKRSLLGTLQDNGTVENLPPYAAGLACY